VKGRADIVIDSIEMLERSGLRETSAPEGLALRIDAATVRVNENIARANDDQPLRS